MSSPNAPTAPTRSTIHIPGGLMSTPNWLCTLSQLMTWQGIPGQQTTPGNKENIPVASLGGGDAVPQCQEALRCQAIMSPEIWGLEMPKVISDVFYGEMVIFCIISLLKISLLDRPISPHHPLEYWLNNPAWIGKHTLYKNLVDDSILTHYLQTGPLIHLIYITAKPILMLLFVLMVERLPHVLFLSTLCAMIHHPQLHRHHSLTNPPLLPICPQLYLLQPHLPLQLPRWMPWRQ